ncbi:MAG TPA: MFS transporter [Thermomicrobiales bacterium]|nr:MFS transporter [Thermomicrobiales bacterium]
MNATPVAPAPPRSSMFIGLRLYPAFRLLWLGTVLTFLGQWMKNIALGWHMLVLTDSPFMVGMIAFASGIPFLIVALPAGALVDRADERKVLLFSQWSSMLVAAVLAVMIMFDLARPWHLLIAAGLSGTIMALNQTVRQTLVPALVNREHMANAVALNSAGSNAMRIIGPSVAGVVIATLGVAACFFIQAGALLAALLVSVRIKPLASKLSGVATGGLLDGWREVRKRPALGSLIVLTAIPSVLVYPYMQLMPVFARDVFDIGPRGLGLLMAASGLGALLGALAAATMDRVQRKGLAVMALTVVYCAALAGFAASPLPILAMLGLFLAGVTGSIFGSLTSALMLLLTDARVRGRVMAIYMLTNGFTPFGAIALGALAQQYGAPWAVSISCLIATALTAVAALRMHSLRSA